MSLPKYLYNCFNTSRTSILFQYFQNNPKFLHFNRPFRRSAVCLNFRDKLEVDDMDISRRKFYFDDENLLNQRVMEEAVWSNVVSEQEAKYRRFNRTQFDTFVISECLKRNNISLADSYVKYLTTLNERLNFYALSAYLILLAQNKDRIKKEQYLLVYNELKEEKYLPTLILENIIKSLCLCDMVDEAMEVLTQLNAETSVTYMSRCCNTIISTVANSSGFEEASKMYHEELKNKLGLSKFDVELSQETIKAFMLSIKLEKSQEKKEEWSRRLFEMLINSELSLNEENAKVLCTISEQWKCDRVKVSNNQMCSSCQGKLRRIPLTDSTFNKLKVVFEEKAVKGADIFRTTTPEEWNNFTNFLKRSPKFDIVIDGLNVLYNLTDVQANDLFRKLLKKSRVLLITRNHFRKKLYNILGPLQNSSNLKIFYVKDITKDDAFILFAALHSGIHCEFITRDYLRNHVFLMGDPDLKKFFIQWQSLRQILLAKKGHRIRLMQPYNIHRVPQWDQTTGVWHLPVEVNAERDYIESCNEWICLKGFNDHDR